VQDAAGAVYGSTFAGPPRPRGNPDGEHDPSGGAGDESAVKVATLAYRDGSGQQRVTDVAAPVDRSTLGTVHVGMNLQEHRRAGRSAPFLRCCSGA